MVVRRLILSIVTLVLVLACAGPEGPSGEMGPKGAAGERGPAPSELQLAELVKAAVDDRMDEMVGPSGPRGVAGTPGRQGPVGETGSIGKIGATGTQGVPGPAGGAGSRGEMGLVGAQGIPGLVGPQGIPGPVGPPGTASNDYFIVSTGSETERLNCAQSVEPYSGQTLLSFQMPFASMLMAVSVTPSRVKIDEGGQQYSIDVEEDGRSVLMAPIALNVASSPATGVIASPDVAGGAQITVLQTMTMQSPSASTLDICYSSIVLTFHRVWNLD